jgi:hypothetical protein
MEKKEGKFVHQISDSGIVGSRKIYLANVILTLLLGA